jgi:hypothetical protein
MNKIEKLREQARKINNEIYEKEHQELVDKVMPQAKKLIGKCHKYYNSYGEDNEKWWLYQKVTDVSSIMNENKCFVKVNEFQKDCFGEVKFKKNDLSFRDFNYTGEWIEISEEEYQEEKNKLLKILKDH